jgi:hypothetical protein
LAALTRTGHKEQGQSESSEGVDVAVLSVDVNNIARKREDTVSGGKRGEEATGGSGYAQPALALPTWYRCLQKLPATCRD